MRKYSKSAFIAGILLCLLSNAFAQKALLQELKGEWIKEEITRADGSPLYDPATNQSSFIIKIISSDSIFVSYDGKNSFHKLRIEDSVLQYQSTNLKIVRLDKPILEVLQVNTPKEMAPIRIKMAYKPTFDLSLKPETYKAKNGELVYLRYGEMISPRYVNGQQTAMDFIYSNFGFPEYRKGGFVVRFVITDKGKMEGLRLIASSSDKYDDKLIKAVQKTSNKWLPAEYNGKKVNCEVEFNFDLGFTPATTQEDPKLITLDQAREFTSFGDYYFDERNYKTAIYYYSKAIEKDPYQVDAQYRRAASYIITHKLNEACGDYYQLKILNQVKAAELFDKYCSSYSPKPTE